jgi:broad specificity phosphatase PhoE
VIFYAVRHGQTDWNAQGRVCGRTDLPLNEAGRRQAEETARKLAGLPIERIVCSPMLRARQTAAFAAQALHLPVRTDARLIEQDYGIYEGVPVTDEGFLRAKRQFAVRYPGGESMMQVAARVYALLDEERARGGGPVLLVCHGGVLRLIHTYFADMDNDAFFHYSAKNAQIETYEAP